MEFRCWMGVTVEGTSYIIAEKIRYKEKTSDDIWTEYGLITDESTDRKWLSIADGGLSCSLSSPVGKKIPKGYRLRDRGTEVVTAVWGDTDAAVGDEAAYEQYETADGKYTFFMEDWNGEKSASMGRKIAAADIAPVAPTPAERLRAMARTKRRRVLHGIRIVLIAACIYGGIPFILSVLLGDGGFGIRDWHDFRRFVQLPYALHERLSDAPYYHEEQEEDEARLYTVQMDAGAAALDLIEGVDGMVQDAFVDLSDAAHPIVIRTQEETARITKAEDGTARVVLVRSTPDRTPMAEQLQRDHVLVRYSERIRTGDTCGRAGVVQQERASSAAGSLTHTDTGAGAAAPHADTPAPPAPAPDVAQRHTRHLMH